jgi:hypothetical protein
VFFLQAPNPSLGPVAAPLIRIAGSIQSLFERLGGSLCRRGHNVWEIRAGFDVLDIIANEADGKAMIAGVDINLCEVIEQSKF